MPRVSARILSRTCPSTANRTDALNSARASPLTQPAHLELRQVPELLAGHACREHEPHGLRQQPAGDERERQRRGLVQPLRVVDDAQQGTFLGRLGQQAEHGEADQEPIRRRPRGQAEDRPQRVTLWAGQPLETIEQRYAQLVQAGERQLHLGLDSRPPARRSGPTPTATRCSSSAVFPIPASPRTTNDRLVPRRTSSIKPSSRAHSFSPTEKAHRGLDSPTPAPHRTRSVDSLSASPRGSQGPCAFRSSRAGLRAAVMEADRAAARASLGRVRIEQAVALPGQVDARRADRPGARRTGGRAG